ncbi:MAG: PAS domain S-box protein, partial [Gemmatimonadota bacterium]|nr:PAS domain S-box protein [Gemmatimonadota bacterium]
MPTANAIADDADVELHALIAALADVVVVLDRDGYYRKVEPSALGRLVRPPEELIGHSLHEVFSREQADHFLGLVRRALDSTERVEAEYAVTIGVELCWFSCVVIPLSSDRVLWVARDITARKRTEEALRSSEERYRLLALATNDAVWEWDCEANTLTWNDAIRTLFGYGLLDRGGDLSLDPAWWDERVHPEDRDRVLTTFDTVLLNGDEVWREEYRFRLADGRYASVLDCAYIARDAAGRPVRVIGAMIDVSHRHELEARLRQSQKLEALGRIAAGIAHDFNNIIAAIRCSAELLLLDLAEGDPRRDDATEIVRVATRGAALTKQILAFGRRQELHPRRVELNAMLAGLTPMLQRLIAAAANCTGSIVLETVLAPDLSDLRVDPTQLEQVVTNLVVNSRDAMPDGGTITIETALEDGSDGDRWVVLSVRDTGIGISDEVRAHIFEPFFTTKGVGKGAGLGLATAYGIVEQSGGRLT